MLFSLLFQLTVLGGLVAAYPAQTSHEVAPELKTRDCSAHIEAFNAARRAKRSMGRRSLYSSIQNNTCITSPQVSGADNWVQNAPVRTDLTEGQAGVQLVMDIGVMDMSTCSAMPNALVEIWSANAVGQYGSTFLRGGTPTSSSGVAELNTIFPGFTQGAASHIGVRVHPNWTGGSKIATNSAAYIGRLYFTDGWSKVISGVAPYNGNSIPQTPNAQDPVWAQANSQGYSAVVDIEEIHDDWPEGVVGYITVGVNPKTSVTTN